MKMEQTVPKRRYTKFRRREITQKKTYNYYNFFSSYGKNLIGVQMN